MMVHLPVHGLDVVRPLHGNRLIRSCHRKLGKPDHERFKVQMMDRIPRGLEHRFQPRANPLHIVFHAVLGGGEFHACRNLVNGLDALPDELLNGPISSRQIIDPAHRFVLGAMIPKWTLVRCVAMSIRFNFRGRRQGQRSPHLREASLHVGSSGNGHCREILQGEQL